MEFISPKTEQQMKTLTHNWHLMRILRVVLAIAILVQAWYAKDSTTAVFGVILLMMGLFNIGCCGANGCYTPIKKNNPVSNNPTEYEEVV